MSSTRMPTFRGRRLRAAAIAVLALALGAQGASPARAVAQTLTPLKVITTPIELSAGVYYAQALGLFKKHGLDVTIQAIRSGEAAAVAVAGGAAQIGVGNVLSLAIAHTKGLGLTLIAPAARFVKPKTLADATVALVVNADSPITDAKGFAGKTIAVQALKDLNEYSTEAWLDQNGGNSKSVKFIEVPSPEMGAELQKHLIDGAEMSTPFLTVGVVKQKLRVVGVPYEAVASTFVVNGWYAKHDWVEANRDTARRFAQAVTEAQKWANLHPEESAKILAKNSKLSPEILSKMPRAILGERLTASLLQPAIDMAARYHAIRASFPAADMFEQLL